MKVHNILYLTDNYIYLRNIKSNKDYKKKISKGIIINTKIANINKFNMFYNKFLNEFKLNKNLFGETIKIIVNPMYTAADINILKNVFLAFNYRKVLVDYETKYYKLNSNNAYLNIRENIASLSYQDEYRKTQNILIPEQFFFSSSDFLAYIKYQIKDRDLYLLGTGDLYEEVEKNFEVKYFNKTYIFSNNENYFISQASLK